MSAEELPGLVKEFRLAARSAIEAGADGVELHAANGYLLHQFLCLNTNVRQDEYGGQVANRARLVLEVARAVVEEIGADRVGIRFSPNNGAANTDEGPNYREIYRYLIKELDKIGLVYVHLMHIGDEELLRWVRQNWSRCLIVNRPGRPVEQIGSVIAEGLADMEAVGQPVLANPDLVFRLQNGLELNTPNPKTFYAGTEVGLTDYPFAS